MALYHASSMGFEVIFFRVNLVVLSIAIEWFYNHDERLHQDLLWDVITLVQ